MAEVKKDPGLQPERTAISWSRTLYLMLVVAALYLKSALHNGSVLLNIGAGLLFIASSITLVMRERRLIFVPDTDTTCTIKDLAIKKTIATLLSLVACMTAISFLIK
ncbi:DUF202 domain-containing protein [Pantoea sp. ME81]|uniref:DUF202 domain-containing protein n=1 Tax=Pantoea sp. ME81 TaxID=2743935 RepID=UPI0015F6EE7D